MNPEILHHHPSAEEILFETYAVASAADSRYFTHRHSDIGEMFLTGNYGGYQQFFANDVFETVVSLDFTKFDEFSGQSAISASVFSIKDKGLVSFFNINRFEYEKFTYGLMLEFSSSNPIKELVHSEGSGAWGDFLDSESPVRQSVLNWLNSLSAHK